MTSEHELSQDSVIEVILNDNVDLSGSTLITGFYGVGKTGFLTVNHLVEELKAERVGTILTTYLPPFVTMRNGKLTFPFELYKFEKYVFLVPYFEPYKYEQRAFAEQILEWAKSKGVQDVFLIGGLDARLRKENETFVGRLIKTSNAVLPDVFKEIPLLDEGLFVTGPLALFIMFAELEGLSALGLLAFAERSRPDPKAAAQVVEVLAKYMGMEINVEKLLLEADKIEQEILAMLHPSNEGQEEPHESQDRGYYQ